MLKNRESETAILLDWKSIVANNQDSEFLGSARLPVGRGVERKAFVSMSQVDSQIAELGARFEKDGITHLLIQFVDIHGAAKVKLVPAQTLRSAADSGAGFAGGAVWGMGQGPHSHDMQARADLATYTPLPYEPGVARFAAQLYVDGRPHPFCPRVNLKRVLEQARQQGYLFNAGIEPEFFLVEKNADGSIRGYIRGAGNSFRNRKKSSFFAFCHLSLSPLLDTAGCHPSLSL